MFFKKRILILGLSLLGLIAMATTGLAGESEANLLAQLENKNTSLSKKAAAFERLAVVGTEAAVPLLASLLDDQKLSHYARYGLEPIPSAKVDEALVKALAKLQGKHLIGVIQSIASRGKPEAIGPLAEKLGDEDREVAKAAAHGIARLGTPQAGNILLEHLSGEFAEACLVGAKKLAQQGHKDQAVALFMKLSHQDDAPQHIRQAAMLQAVLLQQNDGLELLTKALTSDNSDQFNTGLRIARLIDSADASRVSRDVLKNTSPAHASLLITLLGDLADAASLPVVLEAVGSDNESVRIAALEALTTLGGSRQVALLLDAAMDPSAPVAAEALKTLVALQGEDVDQAVLDLLEDQERRDMAIELIGKRRLAAAVPRLVAMINGPSRLEVVAALGETVSLKELDVLGERLNSESAELREAVSKALHAACYRMPDRDATVAKLTSYLRGASNETVQFVMDELRRIGGAKALAAVANAANSDDATRREYATQALGGWLDTSAAPVLLELAQSEGATKYGIRGIRGYIRLARQFSMPEDQRVAMCREALRAAKRDEDKKLVLAVLQRYPSLGMLRIAVDTAKNPSMKGAALDAARVVASKIKGQSTEVESLLVEAGLKSSR